MTGTKFDYDDVVVIDERAPLDFHPGEKAWIIGVFADRSKLKFEWLPPGVVYTVEFEDGTAIDLPEHNLRFLKSSDSSDSGDTDFDSGDSGTVE